MFNKFKKTTIDYCVAGLGNPEAKYNGTRHNIGFDAMDALCKKTNCELSKKKFNAFYGIAEYNGKRILLIKPMTYMNNSGEAVREFLHFYKMPIEKLIVMCGEISLDPGKLRIRRNGSSGGQNGMNSIIDLCGSNNFPRIKIGVGNKPHPDYSLADWVLGKFSKDDRVLADEAANKAAEAVLLICDGKIDRAMNLYNS